MLRSLFKTAMAIIIAATICFQFPGATYANAFFPDPELTITAQTDGAYLFHFTLPEPANSQVHSWHWTISSENGQYFACNGILGYDQPSQRDYIWDGKTSCGSLAGDGVVFPPGHYHGRLTVEGPVYFQQGVTYFDLSIPGLEPTPTPTPSSTPSPTPTPTPVPEPDPVAKLHPVLLIHGLTGYPELWRDASHNSDYFAMLESWGYPENYVAAYHYSGVGVGKGGYNNQGDIPEMAAGMTDAVEQLHQASLARGGDGLVDIVCHSMGGLIARQYLKEHPTDHHLGKVVSIGTPYQGSWLMEVDSDLGVGVSAVNPILRYMVSMMGLEVDPSQTAENEMVPNSPILKLFNTMPRHDEVHYYTIFGQIPTDISATVFDMHLVRKDLDIGDGVVLEKSASTVSSHQPSSSFAFKDLQEHHLEMKLDVWRTVYNFIDGGTKIANSNYFHNSLTQQSDVQGTVKEILLNE